MASLDIEVVSPERRVATVKGKSINLPGSIGYMTILPDHAGLVSDLGVGSLVIDKIEPGESLKYFVSEGYLQVDNNSVTVIVDTIEKTDEIDQSRAEKSKIRAVERLNSKDDNIDFTRAEKSLKRAEARLAHVALNR